MPRENEALIEGVDTHVRDYDAAVWFYACNATRRAECHLEALIFHNTGPRAVCGDSLLNFQQLRYV